MSPSRGESHGDGQVESWLKLCVVGEADERGMDGKLISKFTKPTKLVMDPFVGTFTTTKACILLSKHRRFVGSEGN